MALQATSKGTFTAGTTGKLSFDFLFDGGAFNLESQLNQLTCIYRNESEITHIIRISQTNVAFFERVVLPSQCVQFCTSSDALLEICEGIMSGLIHCDTIPCYQLAISTGIDIKQNISITNELHRNSLDTFAMSA